MTDPNQNGGAPASRVSPAYARLTQLGTALAFGARTLISFPSGRYVRIGLLAIVAFIAAASFGWLAPFESWLRDYDRFFDQSSEGLIIVDAPQLFTRERLVNERLLESEWIDEQLKLVSSKLDAGQFGKADAVTLTELILSANGNAKASEAEADAASLTRPNSDTPGITEQKALETLKGINELKPSPLAAFSAARDFRERLLQQRYETILDDAHDLGENTLHRLNFHLTISPARRYSDSLVAISVRMSETFDHDRMLEHYSKLMVEVRKKMQELVGQLVIDRSLIFDPYGFYRLESTEQDSFERYLNVEFASFFNGFPKLRNTRDDLIEISLRSMEARRLRGIARDLKSAFENKWFPDFWNKINTDNSGNLIDKDQVFFADAAKRLAKECSVSIPYSELLGADRSKKASNVIDAHFMSDEVSLARLQPAGGQMNPGNEPEAPEDQLNEIKQQGRIEERKALQNQLREPVNIRCWNRTNATLVSKLRLLGTLYHLKVGLADAVHCDLRVGLRQAVTTVLDDIPDQQPTTSKQFVGCKELLTSAQQVKARLEATDSEIGYTGLAQILQRHLSDRPMETTRRARSLGDFFDFSTENCTIENCPLIVRTKSEQLRPMVGTSSPRIAGVPAANVGQQEALRLFLELSCFSDARSYTVWPRAGERDSTIASNLSEADGSVLSAWFGARAQIGTETSRRRDRDHIFGIGDWGRGKSDPNAKPCAPELMTILEDFEIDHDFISWIKTKISSDLRLSNWWKEEVIKPCIHLELANCNGGIDLQTLADIAVYKRFSSTSVGWIVAPRSDQPGGAPHHEALSLPLSAIVSLPSWWGRLKIDVTTCWARPRRMLGQIAPGSLCEGSNGKQENSIELPLPGKPQDVLQKLGFFILRTPYLDIAQQDRESVEAGRSAQVRLVGGRLWKNPRVRLGAQWQDRIEVLPNMQGLIATFNCVQPSTDSQKQVVRLVGGDLIKYDESATDSKTTGGPRAGRSPPDSLYEFRPVQVWTSEGVTGPHSVQVFAFRPRHMQKGEPERPCWMGETSAKISP